MSSETNSETNTVIDRELMPDIAKRAWWAGLFDGEGRVSINKNKSKTNTECIVSLEMCNEQIVQEFAHLTETPYKTTDRHKKNNKSHWQMSYEIAIRLIAKLKFLQAIEPFSLTKKPEIRLAIQYIKNQMRFDEIRPSPSSPLPDDIRQERLRMSDEMSRLKEYEFVKPDNWEHIKFNSEYQWPADLTTVDFHWAGGILDGEGSIGISPKNRRNVQGLRTVNFSPFVALSMTHLPTVLKFASIMGCGCVTPIDFKRYNPNSKWQYRWVCEDTQSILNIIGRFMPILKEKNIPGEIVQEFCEDRITRKKSYQYTPELWLRDYDLYARVTKINNPNKSIKLERVVPAGIVPQAVENITPSAPTKPAPIVDISDISDIVNEGAVQNQDNESSDQNRDHRRERDRDSIEVKQSNESILA